MKASVIRTHRNGMKPQDRDRDPPVLGEIMLHSQRHPQLNRTVSYLKMKEMAHGGIFHPPKIPDLQDPQLLTLATGVGAMMIAGFEEINGRRYYQGWYIRLE